MPLPPAMTAIAISAPGGPEVLVPEERPVPHPGAGEILVKVRRRRQPAGRDAAQGPLSAAARRVRHSRAGDRRRGGGARRRRQALEGRRARHARWWSAAATREYCVAHETHALPVPAGLSDGRSGGDPGNLFHRLAQRVRARRACKAGETLLVHGGTSGIGTTAIQLAKAFGARVITTAGSPEKCEPAASSARTSRSTTRRRISSPRPRPRPTARAPTSSSTWSAATISSAITRPPRSRAASCRLRSRAARRRPSISAASCSSG